MPLEVHFPWRSSWSCCIPPCHLGWEKRPPEEEEEVVVVEEVEEDPKGVMFFLFREVVNFLSSQVRWRVCFLYPLSVFKQTPA